MIIYLSDIYVRKSPFLKGAFLFLNMSEQVISHEKIAINDEFSTFLLFLSKKNKKISVFALKFPAQCGIIR